MTKPKHDFKNIPLEPGECMKNIDAFPGYYVTTSGRVLSARIRGDRVHHHPIRALRPSGGGGVPHLGVSLHRDGYQVSIRVHRLVAEAFLPNPYSRKYVRHMDGNSANNHVSNLAWGTCQENENDKHRHGTWRAGLLSAENVKAIRIAHRMGWRGSMLSAVFGVSKCVISNALNGRTYSWVKE